MRRTLHSIAALPMPRQRYADGGFVHRLKQIVGIDPERNARIAEYRAQAEREKQAASQPPASPTPQPQSAISGYNGMSAAERRMKEQGLKDGGHVRGPGTGTSDSIPAMLSDGEFVMPADTVRKVGVRRLQDLVDMTHAPSGKTSQATHFADGGPASYDEFEQKMAAQRAVSNQRSQAAFQAMDEEAKAAASAAAAMPSAPSPSTAPANPPVAAPANPPVTGGVSQIPTGAPPGGPTAPATTQSPGGVPEWVSGSETGRNIWNAANALPGVAGALPVIARTGGAITSGINAASRLLNAGAGAAAISALPGSAGAQTMTTSTAGAGRGDVNPPAVNPLAPAPVSPPAAPALSSPSNTAPSTTSDVTRVGNSYSGANVAGDITINGQAPRAGGQVSSQNMTAADNLAGSQGIGARERLLSAGTGQSPVGMTVEEAQRQGLIGQRTGYDPAYDQRLNGGAGVPNTQAQDARSRLLAAGVGVSNTGAVMPGSFTGGYSGNVGSTSTYGNMRGRSPEQRLRDAEVSASSITNKPEWGGRGAQNSAAMLGYRAALQQDSDIRQNQAGASIEEMRQTGSLQREGMQQSGETQRTNIRAQRDDAANQIARGRLTLEQIAAGYQNRASERMDRAQAELESAKTPEAQRSARERLLALAGKAPENEWKLQVTPPTKYADGSTSDGSVYKWNTQSGETARVDAGQGTQAPRVSTRAQFDALPKGATYLGADGRTYRKPV